MQMKVASFLCAGFKGATDSFVSNFFMRWFFKQTLAASYIASRRIAATFPLLFQPQQPSSPFFPATSSQGEPPDIVVECDQLERGGDSWLLLIPCIISVASIPFCKFPVNLLSSSFFLVAAKQLSSFHCVFVRPRQPRIITKVSTSAVHIDWVSLPAFFFVSSGCMAVRRLDPTEW